MDSRYNGNFELASQDTILKYKALLQEANIEMDTEALMVITNLLRVNVSPDELYSVLKQVSPVCGILKRFRLKSKTSTE